MKGKKSSQAPEGWPPAGAEDPIPEADQELFLEALQDLSTVPDKDKAVSAPPAAGRLPTKKPLPRKAILQPDDTLDLHHMTQAEARLALGRFVGRAAGEGLKQVLVITGKGLSSPGGVSVLKKELERWLRSEGRSLVRSYSEAPRALGGRGAFLLRLR